MKQSVCRPRKRISSPNFYEKCFNGYLSYRLLPFIFNVTFVLDAMIFHSIYCIYIILYLYFSLIVNLSTSVYLNISLYLP